jgi:hypothetical protein
VVGVLGLVALAPALMRPAAALAVESQEAVNADDATPEPPKIAVQELSDVELAEQSAKLDALTEKWKKREEELEYVESIRSGFGPGPERINGRFAMFFLVTGLVTEYYTGQSIPQQVYTALQTLSIVE